MARITMEIPEKAVHAGVRNRRPHDGLRLPSGGKRDERLLKAMALFRELYGPALDELEQY
jgi:hypothetical protein